MPKPYKPVSAKSNAGKPVPPRPAVTARPETAVVANGGAIVKPAVAKPAPAKPVEAVAPAPVIAPVKPEPVKAPIKAEVAKPEPVEAVAAPPPAPEKTPEKTKVATVRKAVEAGIATVTDTVSAIVEKAADAVVPATPKVAPTAQKEVTLMATAFEAPKAFGDINERAKGALEKGGKFVAEFGEFAKGNVEAVVESTRITAKGFESLGQDAADFTRKSFEGATANLRNLASVKSPTELFKLHSDYVRSAFDDLVAQQSKSTEAFIKLAGDAAQPLSNRFALAAEKVKTIA